MAVVNYLSRRIFEDLVSSKNLDAREKSHYLSGVFPIRFTCVDATKLRGLRTGTGCQMGLGEMFYDRCFQLVVDKGGIYLVYSCKLTSKEGSTITATRSKTLFLDQALREKFVVVLYGNPEIRLPGYFQPVCMPTPLLDYNTYGEFSVRPIHFCLKLLNFDYRWPGLLPAAQFNNIESAPFLDGSSLLLSLNKIEHPDAFQSVDTLYDWLFAPISIDCRVVVEPVDDFEDESLESPTVVPPGECSVSTEGVSNDSGESLFIDVESELSDENLLQGTDDHRFMMWLCVVLWFNFRIMCFLLKILLLVVGLGRNGVGYPDLDVVTFRGFGH